MIPEWYGLKTNCQVLGTSQAGKSKFLESAIRQWIESGNSAGFCLIDWHGTLYHSVLDYLAYLRPARPIVLLNPAEPDFITPYNPFVRRPGELAPQVSRNVAAVLDIWGDDPVEVPTLQRVLKMVFFFALVSGEPIQHAAQLLMLPNSELRSYAIKLLKDYPWVRQQWAEMQYVKTLREWHSHILSTENRLTAFLGSKGVTRFMGLNATLDFDTILNEGAVVLVNLGYSDYLERPAAQVFASCLLNDFFHATMKRVHKPSPFILYLDECQNYLGQTGAKMLDQVLKSGMRVVLAHHQIGQFKDNPQLQDSIRMNAQIKVVFSGLPYEQACATANDFFIGKLNQREIKETYYRTITRYEEEFHFTETDGKSDSESEFAEETGKSHTDGRSMVMGTRYAPRQELEKAMDVEWTREEKLSRCAEMLMNQAERHCFVKLPRKTAFPYEVPLVDSYLLNPATVLEYEKDLNTNALPAAEVDRLLAQDEKRFLLEAPKENDHDRITAGRPRRKKSVLP